MIHICLAMLLITAQVLDRCGQCGMDLSKFHRTQYEIRWTDGSVTKTCGIQCGLTQQILHRDKFKSSMAKDYYTGSLFDARTGYYVFGSRVVPDMAPGFIAFQKRADAEKFQKESGGRIMSFDESLSAWAERKANR
jgi:copper chaperone NosL